MERLTERERNVDGTGVAKEEITDGLLKPFADKILTKLAVYEDLEEQGLLVRLPCKVGTEVFCYFPGDSHYTKCQIKKIEICQSIFGNICYFAESVAQRGRCCRYYDNEFGKFLFLTREEAEKKLEELKK
jgi:hypothetical protein